VCFVAVALSGGVQGRYAVLVVAALLALSLR